VAEWPVASLTPTGIVDLDAWDAAGQDPTLYVFLLRHRGELAPLESSFMPMPGPGVMPVARVPDPVAFL
jgi:hypothetical protein